MPGPSYILDTSPLLCVGFVTVFSYTAIAQYKFLILVKSNVAISHSFLLGLTVFKI